MDQSQRCYTVKQVAELWQCSPRKVYFLLEEQQLACIRMGHGKGNIRIKQEHLDAFERANEVGAQECSKASQTSKLCGDQSETATTSNGGRVVNLGGFQRAQMIRTRQSAS
ncbi:MAG: hypothetical protein COV35_10875 [Alphaproteobacteria bacterium CG11_big_fil_rev_8_21_14_0_20_39_49]|nr:MAG: hypothetical protein COV35_10875 [Alphaproteobacteria bacterium CG11_big_fil_rev_8_21_14_0_20_39_49]